MNRPAPEEHCLTVSVAEALLRVAPAWPSRRPEVPAMCCEHCLKAAVAWAWRCARALHLAAFESYDDAGVDAGEDCPSLPGSGWPWALPADLMDARDFCEAAAACVAAAEWCDEVATRLARRLYMLQASEDDREVLDSARRHMVVTERQLSALADLLVGGAKGRWRRSEAVEAADDMCHRLGELVLSPWP